jgi:hypothetical protein
MAKLINFERIKELLSPQGFTFSSYDNIPRSMLFIRTSKVEGLFESLAVWILKNAVEAEWRVDVNCFPIISPFCRRQWIEQPQEWHAYEGQPHSAVVRTVAAARAWENWFCATAPELVASFAISEGSRILEESKSVRTYCKKLRALMPRAKSLDVEVKMLRDRANETQQKEADRLAHCVDLTVITNVTTLFETACLAWALFADEVEPGSFRPGFHPWHDHESTTRIQMLADILGHGYDFYRDWKYE